MECRLSFVCIQFVAQDNSRIQEGFRINTWLCGAFPSLFIAALVWRRVPVPEFQRKAAVVQRPTFFSNISCMIKYNA